MKIIMRKLLSLIFLCGSQSLILAQDSAVQADAQRALQPKGLSEKTFSDLPTALATAKAQGKPVFVYVFDSI